MTTPGVTIAIPNWNHELLLSRSILSALRGIEALAREGYPAELIVIDDGSKDGSLPLLRNLEAMYYDAGMRVLACARNMGLAHARNTALEHAQFPYIAFMDADNELTPENLSIFLRSIVQTEAAAVYGNLLVRCPTQEFSGYVYNNESFQTKMFVANYIDAFAMIDCDQIRELGGYDASFNPHEDYECWLRLATHGRKLVHVPVVFGHYYVMPNSMIMDHFTDLVQGTGKAHAHMQRMNRVFNQFAARDGIPLRTEHLRYHPDIGYLCETA